MLCQRMQAEGHTISLLHGGDMSAEERDSVIDAFRSGKSKVLITTNVLARGIDILQVNSKDTHLMLSKSIFAKLWRFPLLLITISPCMPTIHPTLKHICIGQWTIILWKMLKSIQNWENWPMATRRNCHKLGAWWEVQERSASVCEILRETYSSYPSR